MKKRNDKIEFDIRLTLKNLKRGPFKLDLGISQFHNLNTNYITTDPKEVIKKVTDYNIEYFKEKDNDLNNMEDWEDWYINRVNNDDYNQLLVMPITKIELEKTIKYLPKNKSPGASGVTYELITRLGDIGLDKLLNILNEALINNNIHKSWNHGIIIPIPKKPGVNGELELYRPITLLETSRKIFTRILTNRLNKFINEKNLLKGLNVGFQENKRATDLGFAILRLNELCRIKNINFEILSLDVAKAYNSVLWDLLEKSIKRLGILEIIMKIIKTLTNNRIL